MAVSIPIPSELTSKKFRVGALASVLAYLGLRAGMSHEDIMLILSPLGLAIGAQGVADIGKEKAKQEAVQKAEAASAAVPGS